MWGRMDEPLRSRVNVTVWASGVSNVPLSPCCTTNAGVSLFGCVSSDGESGGSGMGWVTMLSVWVPGCVAYLGN